MSISNFERWCGSRFAAIVTMILFVTLSLLASGPHPFDDDTLGSANGGMAICAPSTHSGVPCPLCDWVANAVASPAILLSPMPAPSVETMRYSSVTVGVPPSAPAQPVGRAPPVRFI
ncbi:MAG TPA: hypothetical protein VGM51_17645 [Armatimonadota bacterium]|jgi:hypothetical protein